MPCLSRWFRVSLRAQRCTADPLNPSCFKFEVCLFCSAGTVHLAEILTAGCAVLQGRVGHFVVNAPMVLGHESAG